MASRGETPTITRRRSVLACARCRARRVKCDRAQPSCSNCTKAGALCQPAQQQTTSSNPSTSSRGRRKDPEYGRISKLEEEVARLSREVNSNSPSREASLTPSPIDSGRDMHTVRGKIMPGVEARYFSPFSWAVVAEEISDMETMFGGGSQGFGATGTSSAGTSLADSARGLSLPDDQLHDTLLSIFRHRVDPLVRVLHWPSFVEKSRAFRRRTQPETESSPHLQYSSGYYSAAGFDASPQRMYPNPSILSSQGQSPYAESSPAVSIDPSFVGLLYAVYYAAVVSVIDSPNPPSLGDNINAFDLSTTFKREIGIRVMAPAAGVARTQSIELLQAMVITLSVEPETFDVQLQWFQLGVAIRIAQSLGAHRDGAIFGLRPIEFEVRRRLWSQLCILDVRYAEQLGREPTITLDCYDTSLPLSIDDRDLTEIEMHDAASRRGQDTNFKSHQEIEYAQELQSPFSPMTFAIVETEMARLFSQLATVKYRARDAIVSSGVSSPQLSRARSSSRPPSDKMHLVSKVEHRFQSVYGLSNVESANPLQYLVSELVGINITRAKFINSMTEWKDGYSHMPPLRRDNETTRLFHDAIGLATRILALIHQYANSPYSWYLKRLRDVYTSSFMALNIASGQHIDEESASLAISVLGQLYPIDTTGRFLEQGLYKTIFGKALIRARMRRELQLRGSSSQDIRSQALQVPTAHNPQILSASLAPHTGTTLPTSVASVGAYQTSGNIFEDFDAIMHDPLWSPDLAGADNTYGSWATDTAHGSAHQPASRHQSQPSAQPQTYLHSPIPTTQAYTDQRVLRSPSPMVPHLKNTTKTDAMDQVNLPSFQVQSPGTSLNGSNGNMNTMGDPGTYDTSSPLESSRTWPLPQQQADLQIPIRMARERSLSQPHPPQANYLNIKSPKPLSRTKSMTMSSHVQPTFSYNPDMRAASLSPHMHHAVMAQQQQEDMRSYPLLINGM